MMLRADSLLQLRQSFALAIVVSCQGSTYRKPGALALIVADGTAQSVISGGCLEPMLRDAAMQAMKSNESQSLLFDTQHEDDLLFGSGSGCRGKMRVIIIPVNHASVHPIYKSIAHAFQRQQSIKLALYVDQSRCAQGVLRSVEHTWYIGTDVGEIKHLLDSDCKEYQIHNTDTTLSNVAVFTLAPARKILIIGASPEVPFLIHFAHALGWHVAVADHRSAALEIYAKDADQLCSSSLHTLFSKPDVFINDTAITFDAALIMSHRATTDLEALQILAKRHEPYVGLLGPPGRRDELLSQLAESDRALLLSRLHAPVGLRLGGDGPEPLALSIVAELQKFFHNE